MHGPVNVKDVSRYTVKITTCNFLHSSMLQLDQAITNTLLLEQGGGGVTTVILTVACQCLRK